MRMWNVPCHLMCDSCLVQEHSTLHALYKGLLVGRVGIKKLIDQGLFDHHILYLRHSALVHQKGARGLGEDKTPFHKMMQSEADNKARALRWGHVMVDPRKGMQDLISRCTHCRERAGPYSAEREQQIERDIRGWASYLDSNRIYTYVLYTLPTQPEFKFPIHGAAST